MNTWISRALWQSNQRREKAARRPLLLDAETHPVRYAAFSHIAVSNALLISGMFMPKFAPAALFAAAFTGFSVML